MKFWRRGWRTNLTPNRLNFQRFFQSPFGRTRETSTAVMWLWVAVSSSQWHWLNSVSRNPFVRTTRVTLNDTRTQQIHACVPRLPIQCLRDGKHLRHNSSIQSYGHNMEWLRRLTNSAKRKSATSPKVAGESNHALYACAGLAAGALKEQLDCTIAFPPQTGVSARLTTVFPTTGKAVKLRTAASLPQVWRIIDDRGSAYEKCRRSTPALIPWAVRKRSV